MTEAKKCGYCSHYASGVSKKSGDTLYKKCIPSGKQVDYSAETCKYFDPQEIFFCEKYGQQLHIANCITRRRNSKELPTFTPCKKCRQFEQDVKQLVIDYYVDRQKVIKFTPSEPLRKLARRNGKKRSIKRRSEKPKRVLKKRKKDKPKKRQLKRR